MREENLIASFTRSVGGAAALLFLALAPRAPAQTFTRIGLDGGTVEAIVADPTAAAVLYAGTSGGGVFKTTDGGVTWKAASGGGLGGAFVHALELDPAHATTLFAGTDTGLFRSTDGAATWSPSGSGIPGRRIDALAIEPSPQAVVYASYSNSSCSSPPCRFAGIARSTDGGGTFIAVNDGLEDRSIPTIAVSAAPPYPVFVAASGSEKVWVTSDRGGTWKPSTIASLEGAIPGRLRMLRDTASVTSGPAPAPLGTAVPSQSLAAATDQGVYHANVYSLEPFIDAYVKYQTDPHFRQYVKDIVNEIGPPPTPLPTGTPSAGRPAPLAGTVPAIYAASYEGVGRSTDAGATWALVNNGLTNLDIITLGMSASSTVFASASGTGVFRSTDRGASWSFASRGIGASNVTGIVALSTPPGTIFASFVTGVARSTDGGSTFALATQGLVDRAGEAVIVNGIAAGGGSPPPLYAATSDGVYKSTDSGSHWAVSTTGIGTLNIATVAVDPVTPANVYAIQGATEGGGRLFKSTNAGAAWAQLTALVSAQGIGIDPRAPSRIFTGSGGKFQLSTDGGATFTAATIDRFFNYVNGFAFDPSSATRIFAATDRGVFRSTDGGASFASLTGLQLPSFLAPFVTGVAVDPRTPAVVYAATRSDGLFRSTDGGTSWASFGPGLTTPNLTTLAVDASGRLLVGTGGAGLFAFGAAAGTVALLPSSARAPGAGGAFYTTDVTVANTGGAAAPFVLKFLGHDADGRAGAEKSFTVSAGASTTFADVLGSVFGRTTDFGAIRLTSASSDLRVLSQTSTPGFGGTFGQSVPAARPEDLVTGGTPRSILAVREDGAFRTNLILANAGESAIDVNVTLVADSGTVLGRSAPLAGRVALATKRYTLPPLGMTQVARVVRALGVSADVRGARLVVATPSVGQSFAAYAAVIDNVTNDPRTLLPLGPISSDRTNPDFWLLPSSARASGAGGAFFTTDLTVAYTNDSSARYTLKFLGHDADGRAGAEKTFDLAASRSATYADVLGSVFQKTSDFGAIRVASQYPSSDATFVAVLAQTSTPGFGGTFGQSVPAATAADLIRTGAERSILSVREDTAFRTNLILANAGTTSLDVDVKLVSADGAALASKRYSLPPLGMTQVTKVVRELGVAANVAGARLVLSTPTANGAFAAYAAVIDNVTNDPRTLLPR